MKSSELKQRIKELEHDLKSIKSNNTRLKNAEELLHQKNSYLKKLNQIALEFTNLSSNDDFEEFIAKKAKELSVAKVALFSEYDPKNRTITAKKIEMDAGLLKKAVHMLGTKIQNIHSITSDKKYSELTDKMINIRKTLYEASFKAIPRPLAASIQAFFKIDRFIGIAYLLDGKLYGTSLIGMDKGQPDPPKEILENFIHLAATSLKRKLADKALAESEKKFKLVLENSADAIFITDQKGKYLYTNREATSLLGYTPEEFKNLSIEDINSNKNKKFFYEILDKGRGFFEIELLKKDGKYITTDLNTVLLPNGMIYASCRDITKRKIAEQELKEKESKLIKLNADKGRFIEILGHDLRSPFNSLLGLSELLVKNIRHYEIDKIEILAENIHKSANHSFNLIDDLLRWARADSGNLILEPKNQNLLDVINNVITTLKDNADSKNIVINCSIEKTMNIFADTYMLKTVLRNFVSNAIKFTQNGGLIRISAQQSDTSVTITVSDNGTGISSHNLSKLFDISEKISTKGTSGESGTGLGLLLCKEFVEKHGGKIWVESELGNGSDFKFTIPLSHV